ncbi:MAG: excinuclease ABC subunit UvrA [Defluviitaleaceae bacterium]|nr:excinuclease ABC subunit UvrA [Defluviitaleaceae bacterium]
MHKNEDIQIVNARQNNLKNISINIKKHQFTAVTGISGSGKSSLVFEVLYAEGQRKFFEINNTNISGMAKNLNKADVDSIKGLNPVIALEQKKSFNNPRSTVGTLTGIYNMVRSLYAMISVAYCPECGHKLSQISPSQLVGLLMTLPENYNVEIRRKLVNEKFKSLELAIEELKVKGITQLYIDSQLHSIADIDDFNQYKASEIEILQDRFSIRKDLYKQIISSITINMSIIDNPFINLVITNKDNEVDNEVRSFYKKLDCCEHHIIFKKLDASELSFNDPRAACSHCLGMGYSYSANPEFMVVAPNKGLYQGALHKGIYNMTPESLNGVVLYTLSQEYGFDLYTPYEELSIEVKKLLMYGTGGKRIVIKNPPNSKRLSPFTNANYMFKGFIKELEEHHKRQMLRKANGEDIAINATRQCMSECICPECGGSRLKKPYLEAKVFDKNIFELSKMQLNGMLMLLKKENQQLVSDEARQILTEVIKKLETLCEIGLHYLDINRKSDTLSGGEMQRIKLSSQINSDMVGLVFIMDEPSIGLHAKDVSSLVKMMKRLAENNTMVVVEHNIDVIRESDRVIEIGPGSGSKGGEVIFNGSYSDLLNDTSSLTKDYIVDTNKIKPNYNPRKPDGKAIKIYRACENNLKNIDVSIPLNQVVCITGVSGSGKSTLINSVLVNQLQYVKNRKMVTPGKHDFIEGAELINNVINIDQKMLGTSSTSNPATYMGLFEKIRKIYAEIPSCKEKGYTLQDFSLTKANGLRCHNCNGKGFILLNIQYMPDIESVCPMCLGSYFSDEVKQFKYKNKDISEVLGMSVLEASEFFADNSYLKHKLDIMIDLGLEYLKLGQNTNTISGGEAQRLNLAYELSKRKGNSNNLYVFDEPSVGLHPADIERLIYSINKLVDGGNSAIIIEHDMDIIKTADYIIDVGPAGGDEGGYIVAQGSPLEVSESSNSYTGQFLKQYFGS